MMSAAQQCTDAPDQAALRAQIVSDVYPTQITRRSPYV